MAKILIIDDEIAIRRAMRNILELEKYDVADVDNGKDAIEMIKSNKYDIIFCDIKMPKMDGFEVFKNIKEISPSSSVIMISGHGDIETAVSFLKNGAYDYIAKPLDLNRILTSIKNALDKTELVQENKTLKEKVNKKYQIIGESKAIKNIYEIIDKVAKTNARVLITGENGTGKELVAHELYLKSERSSKTFVEVNCAAIPSELIESELFGHEKGAFTSAIKDKKGKFEIANGGTLFLDEIGDMSLSAQAKVLRALQENKIVRVGGEKEIVVDVRIIAATNKNLLNEIKENRFREDLYHRLNVIEIKVPSLKERVEDIPLLINHFMNQINIESNLPIININNDAINYLKQKHWSGNIRELRNVVERLMILCNKEITLNDIKSFVG